MTLPTDLPKNPDADPGVALDRRLRVFIVEDHPDTRDMLCMLLELLGHDVVTARSMREALATVPPAAGCDVLLTDLGLPDGTGWELLGRLGADRPPYALAMSGYGMSADVAKSKAAGFRHHLIKPMGQEQLIDCLQEAAVERDSANQRC